MNTEKKIEDKILNALESWRCDGIKGDYVYLKDIIKPVSNLIQEERKDAVEGFVEWRGFPLEKEEVKEYLESEGKK